MSLEHKLTDHNISTKDKILLGPRVIVDFVIPNVIGPLKQPIPGYPNRIRGSLRLWRARIGFGVHSVVAYAAVSNSDYLGMGLNIAGLAIIMWNFNSRRKIHKLLFPNDHRLIRNLLRKA